MAIRTPVDQRKKAGSPWPVLAAWIVLCLGAGSLGALTTSPDWYAALNKPSWSPPGWLFGPVWTSLYTMMAVSAWMVWRKGGWAEQRKPLTWFGVQIVLNALWTPIFFGLRQPGWAFAEILLLWLAIAITLAQFARTDRVAAWLLTPYLLWVSFAAVLNATLWQLN